MSEPLTRTGNPLELGATLQRLRAEFTLQQKQLYDRFLLGQKELQMIQLQGEEQYRRQVMELEKEYQRQEMALEQEMELKRRHIELMQQKQVKKIRSYVYMIKNEGSVSESSYVFF